MEKISFWVCLLVCPLEKLYGGRGEVEEGIDCVFVLGSFMGLGKRTHPQPISTVGSDDDNPYS